MPRVAEVVHRTLVVLPALDQSLPDELFQPLRQQGPRHARDPPMDVVEPRAASDELPNDQQRPSLIQHLGGLGHRTELPVLAHRRLPPAFVSSIS